LTKNIVVKPSIRPDIRYPALTENPAGYPVSGFWISRISGQPDIRQKQYPVHPYRILLWVRSEKLTQHTGKRKKIYCKNLKFRYSVGFWINIPVPVYKNIKTSCNQTNFFFSITGTRYQYLYAVLYRYRYLFTGVKILWALDWTETFGKDIPEQKR
jgi:hypothetical protein